MVRSKRINLIIYIAVILIVLMESCTVKSLHQIYDENSIVFKQELIGTWKDHDGEIYKVEASLKNGEKHIDPRNLKLNGYLLKIIENENDSSWIKMRLHIVEIKETVFWNLFPEKNYTNGVSGVLTENLLPVHSFGKVEIENN